MIGPQELLEIKKRLLVAGPTARHLANSDGEFLELEPDEFAVVHESLNSLESDCQRVLAELDVLRGMFADKVGAFFTEVLNAGDRSGSDSRRTVEGVPGQPDNGRCEASRDDEATTGGRSDRSGAARKPRKRSVARRNRRGDSGDQGEVDATTGVRPLDSGASA